MTLQDLIDELVALSPSSARDASVHVGDDDAHILSISYENGEVRIAIDGDNHRYDEGYNEGKANGYNEGYEAGLKDTP